MLSREIYSEFIQNFHPGSIKGLRGIGIECEIPVVTSKGEVVSLALMQKMYHYLASKGFTLRKDESYGMITAATRLNTESVGEFGYAVDLVTVDAGFSTLELALAPQRNLFAVKRALDDLLGLLVPWFAGQGCKLLGYGIHPVGLPARNLLTPGERYLFTEQFSANRLIPQSQGSDCDLLNITASNQCHLEVGQEDAVDEVNLLNAFSGLSIALHANSPVWKNGLSDDFKANREIFWDYCFPSWPGRTGVPPKFQNLEGYIQHLVSFAPFLIKRGEKYFQIPNFDSFTSFLAAQGPVKGKTLFGGDRWITPELNDLHQHISFFWFNARLVPKHGTVESRMCCQQPPEETLCSTALPLGILENKQAALKLMNRFAWASWQQLREDAARDTFAAQIEGGSILPLLSELLEIANQGLQKRGLGEEKFLAPLYKRLQKRKAPADEVIELFQKSGIEGLLETAAFKVKAASKTTKVEELMYSLP